MVNAANSDSLPTVNVTINDFGLRISQIPTPGPKVTIIGGAQLAGGTIPMNEPLTIDNLGTAMRALRNSGGSPSELTLAIEEAVGAGATNVEVVVTDTSVATPFTGSAPIAHYSGLYAKLATTYDTLIHHDVDIVYLAGAYADGAATGTNGSTATSALGVDESFAAQLAEFCYRQTKESNSAFGVIGCTPLPTVAKDLDWQEASVATVSAYTGVNGAWFMTPSLALVAEYTNYLVHDSGDNTIYGGATNSSYVGAPFLNDAWNDYLFGSVKGTDPLLPHSAYSNLMQPSDLGGSVGALDADGNKVDGGAYISVVAGLAKSFGSEASKMAATHAASAVNFVNSNGAAAFAGALSQMAPHIGMTNKPLNPLSQSRALGATQAKKLLNHRIITLLQKPGGYVVTSGITGAFNAGVNSRSDFVRITTTRTTQAMAEVVRLAGEAFIGKPISGPFLAALDSSIDTSLQRAIASGAVRSYDFSISSTPDQQVLGEVTINLSMVPAFELVTINTTISLAKGEGLG